MNRVENRDTERADAGSFSLVGRVAVVTGGGRGIGVGIVEAFLEAGATVVANALTNTHLGKLVDRLQKAHGERIVGLPGDAASADGARDLIARAMGAVGPVDILVNGIGDAIVRNLVDEHETPVVSLARDEQMHFIVNLNMMSAVHCSRAVGPTMLLRKHGRIINLTGVLGGLRGFAGMSLYSAAKSGLAGFTRSLAREWAPHGITVNAIAPGVFPDRGHLTEDEYQKIERTYLPQIPVGRFGEATELGQLARYLASDAASYLTGQVFAFDGGLSA
jgi:NAD(P)-dependent dehydrogenase (short-subunit alcohol dehydrogenase family)